MIGQYLSDQFYFLIAVWTSLPFAYQPPQVPSTGGNTMMTDPTGTIVMTDPTGTIMMTD